MPMNCNLRSRLSTRDFQPWVRFGPTFARPGLDSSRSVADSYLSDQREQDSDTTVAVAAQKAQDPLRPHLHGVLKTQLAWRYGGVRGCLRHEQAGQIVGEQVDPYLFLIHLRGIATEDVHAHSRFDIAKVQLGVPTHPIQVGQLGFVHLTRVKHRGDQDFAAHL